MAEAQTRRSRLWNDDRGTALIEMAFAAPLLVMLMLGIAGYGGYFWLAHSLQQTANDAARSAIAGLDSVERRALVEETVDDGLARISALDPARASVAVEDDLTTLVVRLRYDASDSPFLATSLIPLPSKVIERTAAVRLGGL